MVTVVGVDASLTSTGLARVVAGPGWSARTECVRSKPAQAPTLRERWDRIRGIAEQVEEFAHGADLVVIEGPSYGSQGRGTWERAWLWGELVATLLCVARDVVEVPPTARARFAAGKGNATKSAVIAAMAELYPGLTVAGPGRDDRCDALALASIGAVALGAQPPFPMPPYRVDVATKALRPASPRTRPRRARRPAVAA